MPLIYIPPCDVRASSETLYNMFCFWWSEILFYFYITKEQMATWTLFCLILFVSVFLFISLVKLKALMVGVIFKHFGKCSNFNAKIFFLLIVILYGQTHFILHQRLRQIYVLICWPHLASLTQNICMFTLKIDLRNSRISWSYLSIFS